jgi:hypothetical protein
MEKNVASQKWIVFAFDRTDNTPKTGDAANITANLRIDGGAANPVDDVNPTELEDGYYVFDITQAESNGDLIVICPASSTGDIQVIGVPGAVYTTPPNFPAMGIEADGDLTKVNLLDGHTAQTADHTAAIADIPTVAEFNARSLPSADYVVVGDTIAGVTLVDTCTTNSDMRGTDSAALASVCTEGRLGELDAPNLPADVDLILADTDELQGDWADGGRLDVIIDAILADTGTDGVVVAAASKTGYTLSAAGIDAIADEEYDNDGTAISLRGAIKLMLAVLTGKSSGGGTATIVFRDVNDAKNRISATVDADGNRTAVGTRDAA